MEISSTNPAGEASDESLTPRTKKWLWGVRIAAAISVLILCLPPSWFFLLRHRDPCGYNRDYYLLTGPALAMVPYLQILRRLRSFQAAFVPNIIRGLMLVAPWTAPILALASIMVYSAFLQGWPEGWELAAWAGMGLMQTVLIVSAMAAQRAMPRQPGQWKLRLQYVAKVAVFLFFLLVVLTLSAPLERSRLAANQSSAVASLRTINTAQFTFWNAHPDKGFAGTLAELGPPPGADLIDEARAKGERAGYRFALNPGARDPSGRILHYTITARPILYPTTGCRSFFSDETGVLRETSQDRFATAQDPPLE